MKRIVGTNRSLSQATPKGGFSHHLGQLGGFSENPPAPSGAMASFVPPSVMSFD